MENETPEILTERLVDYASSLRRANKLQLREAIGQALDYFGISDLDERDKFFHQVGKSFGERAARAKKRKPSALKKAVGQEARDLWRAEAKRAGFEDPEDYLKRLEE